MKLKTVLVCICITGTAQATPQEWREECVGYYKMQMPSNLEVALYPIDGLINTKRRPKSEIEGFFWPIITFGDDYGYGLETDDSVQAQFSVFRYDNYSIIISTKSKETIDISKYIKKLEEVINFKVHRWMTQIEKDPAVMISESEIKRKTKYKIKQYGSSFSINKPKYYELHLNIGNRLYVFRPEIIPLLENKILTADEASQIVEPAIQSLMKHFRPRNLYEVPSEQGFCLPYGFISGDSGQEPHEMGVTYRLIDHPDVTIFFQDLGQAPLRGEGETDEGSIKDAVIKMWAHSFLMGANKKEFLSPKWQSIKMDGREGIETYVKATYDHFPIYNTEGHAEYHDYINYGYLAYIRSDKKVRNKKPGLLLYVSQTSWLVKDKPPMSKDELFEIAEKIARSVKRH